MGDVSGYFQEKFGIPKGVIAKRMQGYMARLGTQEEYRYQEIGLFWKVVRQFANISLDEMASKFGFLNSYALSAFENGLATEDEITRFPRLYADALGLPQVYTR